MRARIGHGGAVTSADADLTRQRTLLLREAVRRHATGERRRRFAPVLHVGRPGVRERTTPASLAATDHALRCDLVAAMVAAALAGTRAGTRAGPRAGATVGGGEGQPLIWLTRAGELDREDVDVAWSAATRAAAAEAGAAWTCVVVTRHGWRDPVTGEGRTWQRFRD